MKCADAGRIDAVGNVLLVYNKRTLLNSTPNKCVSISNELIFESSITKNEN